MKPLPAPSVRLERPPPPWHRSGPPRSLHRERGRPAIAPAQRGALLISFALMLPVVLGFMGLALDLAQMYNRATELQNVADAAALAAAGALDGSAAGIGLADTAARQVAEGHRYAYGQSVRWNPAALRFSSNPAAPEADWLSASDAEAAPASQLYAKVDTSELAGHGQVVLSFVRAFSSALGSSTIAARAVAGRSAIKVTPLAVCALAPLAPAAERISSGTPAVSELVQYGFRRGVGYNLLNLNPGGASGVYYLLDPFSPPGTPGSLANTDSTVLAPFFCSGTVALPQLGPGPVNLAQGPAAFPLALQLNSRFDNFNGSSCSASGAPPDSNIKSYTGAPPNWWMSVVPAAQTAASANPAANVLATVAELTGTPPSTYSAASYGPLWAYGPAAAYADPAPATGYAALPRSSWTKLYPAVGGAPTANSNYPSTTSSSTPYGNSGGAFYLAPNPLRLALTQRRVLNIALLACPVPGGALAQAQVLAVGRFFMTAPATASVVPGEFAGVVSAQSLGTHVELFR